MKAYNMHEAKTHLSRIIREVHAGETVLIQKGGQPMALLSPYKEPLTPRSPGAMKGKIEIEDDFDTCDGSITELFLGADG